MTTPTTKAAKSNSGRVAVRRVAGRAAGLTTGRKRALAAGLTFALSAVLGATPRAAHAQEIQLTGPLAGAPAVRDLRQYRKGRLEIAPTVSFTLLDEYERTIFVGGRIQYHFTDWLSLGVWGAFGANLETDLTDQIDQNAPRNTRTAVNLNHTGTTPSAAGNYGTASFADQTAKMKWVVNPQIQLTPFRGKLALFQSIFVDTDAYLHAGVAFVGLQERGDCGDTQSDSCTAPASFALQSRVAVAPSFGLGLNFYVTNFMSLGAEYKAIPFSWNRAGFDTRGSGSDGNFPDNKITSADQTFKFNQMITISLGFSYPFAPRISP